MLDIRKPTLIEEHDNLSKSRDRRNLLNAIYWIKVGVILILLTFLMMSCGPMKPIMVEPYGTVVQVKGANGNEVTVSEPVVDAKYDLAIRTIYFEKGSQYQVGDVYPDPFKHNTDGRFEELKAIKREQDKFLSDFEQVEIGIYYTKTLTDESITAKAAELQQQYGRQAIHIANEILQIIEPEQTLFYFEVSFWKAVRDRLARKEVAGE